MLDAFFGDAQSAVALDHLVNGVEALFRHAYGSRLDVLVREARSQPKLKRALFLVALTLEPSVQDYVRAEHGGREPKVAVFLASLRVEFDHMVAQSSTIDDFLAAAAAAWWVA
jgi:hypothetical protein